jgi:uncharacterized protein YbjT (DUF2867 family)
MKIVLTGSLGHISKPLTEVLLQKGNSVTVISSKPERQKDIEALGSSAAIGTIEDVNFLTNTFKGADAVYCMIPPGGHFFDPNFDITEFTSKTADNYKHAVQHSGIKRMVFLSSIGAHTDKGKGILAFYCHVEKILNSLPADVAITFMRPVGFYYNLFNFINTIKTQGVIATNYGGDRRKPWVSTIDIAAAIAEEILVPFDGRKVRYVASDEISCNEIASILGEAIGKPDLKWIIIPDEKQLNSMIAAGMNPQIAKGFVEMNAGINSGLTAEDYYCNKPTLGKVKMKDFAKEFARFFQSN